MRLTLFSLCFYAFWVFLGRFEWVFLDLTVWTVAHGPFPSNYEIKLNSHTKSYKSHPKLGPPVD